MTDREYKLAVVEAAWPQRYKPERLIEFLRSREDDVALDAVLSALGVDPAKLRNPLPDITLMDELGGLA